MAQKYNEFDQRRALLLYAESRNLAATSKTMAISRPTLTDWKKNGYPVEITGGDDWDTYLERKDREDTRSAILKANEEGAKETSAFLKQARVDVQLLFENARDRLMKGKGLVSFSDVQALLGMYIKLDNQGADRILWMQEMMTKLFKIVAKYEKDEMVLFQIRNDMVAIAAGENRKLGDRPNQAGLPSPVEVALDMELEQLERHQENFVGPA